MQNQTKILKKLRDRILDKSSKNNFCSLSYTKLFQNTWNYSQFLDAITENCKIPIFFKMAATGHVTFLQVTKNFTFLKSFDISWSVDMLGIIFLSYTTKWWLIRFWSHIWDRGVWWVNVFPLYKIWKKHDNVSKMNIQKLTYWTIFFHKYTYNILFGALCSN